LVSGFRPSLFRNNLCSKIKWLASKTAGEKMEEKKSIKQAEAEAQESAGCFHSSYSIRSKDEW